MTDAEVWQEVAQRIARFFRPSPMPQYIIAMIEEAVRKEAAEIDAKLKKV